MHISLKPEIIGELFGFPISNSLVLSLITALLLIGGGFLVVKSLRHIPNKFQNAVELIIESLLDFMTQVLGERKSAIKFFPLVATIFLFILLSNWIGLLPGTGSFGYYILHEGTEMATHTEEGTAAGEEKEFVPFFRSANSDLNTTLALALVVMIAIQVYAVQKLGFFKHLGKFFVSPTKPIQFFVGILELIGEFAKILSFSFRLFGNIFAGEVLLLIVMSLVPFVVPLPFFGLEIFVGFIQALVFSMLTLIFLKVATAEVEH